MTHSPSHTALAWRDWKQDHPDKLAGGILCWDAHMGRQYIIEMDPGAEPDEVEYYGDAIDPTHWQPLPPSPGTEPPQSINSELLEAAKETASFIRNCNGGSRGERINLDRLANLLEVAISNAEKAI